MYGIELAYPSFCFFFFRLLNHDSHSIPIDSYRMAILTMKHKIEQTNTVRYQINTLILKYNEIG